MFADCHGHIFKFTASPREGNRMLKKKRVFMNVNIIQYKLSATKENFSVLHFSKLNK